ncbi:hypothetical protein PGIGA_G00032580 [Pangasianodon gigas]|uniref:Uncharacterized protein n=1 Tax=Pangasianodon gigas TaxID=30993 RepID=A0ACC5WYD3_PANGG|nr:hypothetical protein [Pangasianodon gigas]
MSSLIGCLCYQDMVDIPMEVELMDQNQVTVVCPQDMDRDPMDMEVIPMGELKHLNQGMVLVLVLEMEEQVMDKEPSPMVMVFLLLVYRKFVVIFLRLLGYGPVTNGNEKGPKGKSLSPEAPSLPPVTGYTKGVVQPAEPEPTIGVPTALPLTKGMPLLGKSWKGPKPQFPVVPQGYPSKPIVPEQVPVIPQNKAPKPAQYIPQEQAPVPELAPLIPQGKGPKPAAQPEILQGSPQKPFAPALLPFAQQEAPKPITQVPQPAAPVYPQGKGRKPVDLQPAVPQGKVQKPTTPVLFPVLSQTKGLKPVAPVPDSPQMKDPKPVAPEPAAPQTAGPPLALEPTPAMPQMKGPKVANPGYGPGPWYPNNGGAKASKPGQGYGPKPSQPGYVNPGAGYGYGNGAASLGEMVKGKSGGAGQLPYNGAPIIPARLDGTSPIQPQTAELGPEVKSGHAYGGPYGAQPMGLGSEGKPQVRYGIGGLHFGGSPMGYNSNPYGTYGNPYAAQPYGSKEAGNYNPLEFANPKSAAKYRPYGGQQLGLPAVAGNSGKYGPYAPEPISLSGDAKSSGKYSNYIKCDIRIICLCTTALLNSDWSGGVD